MRLIEHFLQFLDRIMRIYLRGRQAAMAQQLLYSIEIGAIVHQVGGKAVAQDMGTFLLHRGNQREIVFYKRIHRSGLQGFSLFGNK